MCVPALLNTLMVLLLLTILLSFVTVQSKPTKQTEGPCVGMDCLHGVLMHGDEDQGGDNKAEDQYLRFKSKLDTATDVDGPLNAADTYHGAMMHGDTETGVQHAEDRDMLPEVRTKAGPSDVNEALHDMMHKSGDTKRHSWDKDGGNVGGKVKGPDEPEQMMHGLGMHGDSEHRGHAEDLRSEQPNIPTGPSEEDIMHGILMHGGIEKGRMHALEEKAARILANSDSDQKAKLLAQAEEDYKKWISSWPKQRNTEGTRLTVSDSIIDDIQLMKNRYLADSRVKSDAEVNTVDELASKGKGEGKTDA